MTINTSPVGTIHRQGAATDEAREEMMKNLAYFFSLSPTAAEFEIIDTLLTAFTWNYDGYELIFNTAREAHRLVHGEEGRWQKKKK